MQDKDDKRTADGTSASKGGQKQQRKPAGTKGEELSSQGQVDEGSRKRQRKSS
jgi:hypothetical protein